MRCGVIYLGCEDVLSEAVLRKIISQLDPSCTIGFVYRKNGIGYLKKSVKSFNALARSVPFLLLVDLDKNNCAPSLISEWINFQRSDDFHFRVAVREIEAWLLADVDAFSDFLNISSNLLPTNVEELEDPKETLINLVRRSRKTRLKSDIVPKPGSTASVGRNYNEPLIRFVNEKWDFNRARFNSNSLDRMVGLFMG